jgi:hypothetical protein
LNGLVGNTVKATRMPKGESAANYLDLLRNTWKYADFGIQKWLVSETD